LLRAIYASCDNAEEISFTDTVFVRKSNPILNFETTAATCTTGGSIKVNYTGGLGVPEYAVNNGTYQTSNVFNNLGAGTHTITVKDNPGCSLNAAVNIPVVNTVSLQIMADTAVCTGSFFTLKAFTNATDIKWTPSAGLSNANTATTQLTVSQSQEYAATVVLGTCTESKKVMVYAVAPPVVSAGPNKTILQGDKISLDASATGAITYLWTPPQGLSASNILNPEASPAVTTVYTLSAFNSHGCSASRDVEVVVLPDCIKVMEAFTPNGDGTNDVWKIMNGSCINKAKVIVYNRYGSIIFQSNDYRNDWNGTYNGKPVPDGTYYYNMEYELINGKKVLTKGNVTILR
jgi:gliding motility-associated-like protein